MRVWPETARPTEPAVKVEGIGTTWVWVQRWRLHDRPVGFGDWNACWRVWVTWHGQRVDAPRGFGSRWRAVREGRRIARWLEMIR